MVKFSSISQIEKKYAFEDAIASADVLNGDLPIEAQINVLYEIMENILDQGAIRARTVKFKLQKYIKSKNIPHTAP